MDISRRIAFFVRLLPYLLTAGQKTAEYGGKQLVGNSWERVKALWDKLCRKNNVKTAIEAVAGLPDNPVARDTLILEIARALQEDPALCEELDSIIYDLQRHTSQSPSLRTTTLIKEPGWGFLSLWTLANAFGTTVGGVIAIGIIISFVNSLNTPSVLFANELPGWVARFSTDTAISLTVSSTILGTMIGFGQWLVLRLYLRKISGWILASSIGGFIGGVTGGIASIIMAVTSWNALSEKIKALERQQEENAGCSTVLSSVVLLAFIATFISNVLKVGTLVTLVMNGVVIGLAQWSVLRRHTHRAGWWILASTLGWVAGTFGGRYIVMSIMSTTVENLNTPTWEGPATGGNNYIVLFWGLVAGGIIMGLITGAFLVWLLEQPRREVAKNKGD